jgi:PAS domain S-box-containing protein
MSERRQLVLAYAVALAATAVAVLARWLLTPAVGHDVPFISLYAAVVAAVWFGGRGPAVLAMLAGYLASYLLFVHTDPTRELLLSEAGGMPSLMAYLLTCLVIIALGSEMRNTKRRAVEVALDAREKQRQTEKEVRERQKAVEALRAKEAELELVTSRTPLLLTRCSKDRRYVFVNRATAEFFGRSAEDLVGRPIVELLGEAGFAAIEPHIQRVLEGERVEFEVAIPYPHVGRRFMHAVYEPDRDARGEVVGWFASVADVTARRETEEALKENQARLTGEAEALAKLSELSSRLWSVRGLPEGLDEMISATIELLGADMGNVQILDPQHGVLHIRAQRGFRPDFLDFFREVSAADDSACGRALRSGQRTVIEDVEADPEYAPYRAMAAAAGYRAVQSTPLIGRDGRPLGMISTHFRSVHRPDEQELRRLDLYARQAAGFVERCRSDEALLQADRQKDEFLATLAHELRNPLAPIRNAVQLMRLKRDPSPELQWAGDVIDRQMQHMVRLIDDLMDVSRITRNRIELRKLRTDLAGVLRAAVEAGRPLIDGLGHELTLVLPDEPLYVDADPTRLAQVFSNLLNNAAKYSAPRGRIFLTARAEGNAAVVSVRDEGVGIPGEMLSKIFDLFTQVDRSLERSHGGLGIGLTLVKRLVEMHGGSVVARSDGPGKGSEFVVRLPIPLATAATGSRPTSDIAAVHAPTPHCILIVDDNNDAATSLAVMLRTLGYETRTACDGVAALEVAAAHPPDVVLLDIGMPKMSGYEVARRIREKPWGQRVVLIAVTGWGQVEHHRLTTEAGFDHHLVKPADPAALASLLASLPAKYASERAERSA